MSCQIKDATVVQTKHNLARYPQSSYEDFDLGEDSYTDDRSTSPLSIPIVHADEFPRDLDAALFLRNWETESDDWFVLYIPRVPRSLDTSLMYI